MRTIPVDAARVRFISTGKASAVPAWVVLSDGSRRPDPTGRQDVNDAGVPLWRVEVIVPSDDADDRDRTGITEITIASRNAPDAGSFGDLLNFQNLTMQPGYLNKRTNQLTQPRWAADGVSRQGAPVPSGKGANS